MVSWARHLPAPPSGAFWRFSLEFYGRPGIAPCCLDLQDRFGRDVNLVLYACWVGASGRGRLTLPDLARAEAAVEPWRRRIVERLRELRRLAREEAESEALHAALRAAELKAEEHAQNRLEILAPGPAEHSGAARFEDVLANLALYLGPGAAFEAAAPIRLALAAETGLPAAP
jgi:uncharacterized protein (TIGR02444 family)